MHNRRMLVFGLLVVWSSAAHATPFFAQSTGLKCVSCHSGFPRLNEFGLTFKANGFRIPGSEQNPTITWRKAIPLAVQVAPQWARLDPGDIKLQFTDTQLLAGGLLAKRTSAFVHYDWYIDGRPQPFPSWEVWAQQVLAERGKLMLKAGQFELPYSYSSVINRTTISVPTVLFGSVLHANDVAPGDVLSGIQVSGLVPGRLRWYVAGGAPQAASSGVLVGDRTFFGRFRDVFARVALPDLAHQVGLFGQLAFPPRNPLDSSSGTSDRRLGLDGTFLWRDYQFQGMLLYGENSDPTGSGHLGTVRGGFLEADRMVTPWLGVTGRFDILNLDSGVQRSFRDAWTLAIRGYPYHLVKLIAEYQRLDHGGNVVSLGGAFVF